MPLASARVIACWIMEGLDGYVRSEFVSSCARLRLDGGDTVPLGLWCDGVATKWDRSESVEFVTLNFPGLGPKWSALRIPIFALDKSFVASRHTHDDVMSLVVWSLNRCCAKTWTVSRHDGSPWWPTDTKRRRREGQALKNRALLVQLTGDWKMHKDIFQFPQHNELHGICGKCTATPSSMKDTSRTAHWRAERLDHWKFLQRQVRQGKGSSPLLYAPGSHASMCLIDWLHCADLGVSQDWIGQVLYMLPLFPGSSQEAQVSSLWLRIQEFCKVYPGPACGQHDRANDQA